MHYSHSSPSSILSSTRLQSSFKAHPSCLLSVSREISSLAYWLLVLTKVFFPVCAIASRHYTSKPELNSIAQEFARDAAGKALVGGQKGVDICQAYLLLGVYPVPKKKWAEDRSWLFQGVAIRFVHRNLSVLRQRLMMCRAQNGNRTGTRSATSSTLRPARVLQSHADLVELLLC